MKKVLLSVMLCFLLVGCGNTLKCTMTEEGEGTDTYKFKFKNDEVVKAVRKMEFEDKDEAKEMCEYYKEMEEEDDRTKVKCSGKTITLTTEEKSYFEGNSKEELKEDFEDEGYKCK